MRISALSVSFRQWSIVRFELVTRNLSLYPVVNYKCLNYKLDQMQWDRKVEFQVEKIISW